MKTIRLKSKWTRICALVLVILAIASGVYAFVIRKQQPVTPSAPATSVAPEPQVTTSPTSIRLLATGDFIAHDSVNADAKKPDGSYDYLQLMSNFQPAFARSDIRFCNDPILNGGEALGVTGYPKFNSPTGFVTDMGKLGCNVVNTASNHSFDFNQTYIDASVDAWAGVPNMLAVAGQNKSQAEHDSVDVFDVKGVKFAFLAYTSYTNSAPQNAYGLNVFSQDFASKQIAAARAAGAQVIIVSMRWGTEYSGEVNAQQKQQAQFLADQGVDLVLGHGPHVVQAAARLKGAGGSETTVFYSLGNFLNTQIPAETLFSGIAAVDFDITSHKITTVQYAPIYMHYEWSSTEAQSQALLARHNLHLYPLEQATQDMIAANQLKTTAEAQKQRLQTTLGSLGLAVPFTTTDKL